VGKGHQPLCHPLSFIETRKIQIHLRQAENLVQIEDRKKRRRKKSAEVIALNSIACHQYRLTKLIFSRQVSMVWAIFDSQCFLEISSTNGVPAFASVLKATGLFVRPFLETYL